MADILYPRGQYYFLQGARTNLREVDLVTSTDVVIATVSLAGTEFETEDPSTFSDNDPLFNNTVIDFTIEASDIGLTAAGLIFKDATDVDVCRADLETTQTLDTEGTFRFAAGTINLRV